MKTTIISYSYSGNNRKLAANLAQKLQAEHIEITPIKPLTYFKMAMHVIFGIKPVINETIPQEITDRQVIFVAPIWMGKIATPLRSVFAQFKGKLSNYSFFSISGGALGPNPKLSDELTKRLGTPPQALHDKQAVEFLPKDPKPSPKETSAYVFSDVDCETAVDEMLTLL